MNGTKQSAEAANCNFVAMVGERSCQRRRRTVRSVGAAASENAGMSNDNAGENPAPRKPKVSWGR